MDTAILDTDILNEVLKAKNPAVIQRAREYLDKHGKFTISGMTRYEILRGLIEKNATRQLMQFKIFCGNTTVLSKTDQVFERAAVLWAFARSNGRQPKDADLLIASTAIENRLVLATGNTKDFDWIPMLQIVDWRNP